MSTHRRSNTHASDGQPPGPEPAGPGAAFAELLAASSLGAPAFRALAARTPPHVAAEIVARAAGASS